MSTDITPSFDMPAHYSRSCFIAAGEHNEPRCFQSISRNRHNLSNNNEVDIKPGQLKKRSNIFMCETIFPNNITTDNSTLLNSCPAESSNSSEINRDTLCARNSDFYPVTFCGNNISSNISMRTRSNFQMSECSYKCYNNLPNKRTTNDVSGNNTKFGNNRSSERTIKLSSQSNNGDMSRTKTEQSLQTSQKSFDDFVYQSFHFANTNGLFITNASTDNRTSSSRHNASLPRRNSEQLIRPTASYESTTPQIKHKIAKSLNNSEIESEYVSLSNRYVPPKHIRLSKVTEGVVCHQNDHINAGQIPPANGLFIADDRVQKTVSESDVMDSRDHTVTACTNQVRTNDSMLKINMFDFKRQVSKKKNNIRPLRTMAETIGSLFSYRTSTNDVRSTDIPRSVISGMGAMTIVQQTTNMSFRHNNSLGQHNNTSSLTRSKSMSDLQAGECEGEENNRNYSDDEDGDDFGFLSYPISFMPSYTSAAMNKAKSPSPGNRIFTKRWRNKSNDVPSGSSSVAMWTPGPQDSYTWSSVSGRRVQLRPASILSLTEAERLALQKIALLKLQSLDIGCTIPVPKNTGDTPRSKKSPLSLKRRSKSVSASALDTMVKDGTVMMGLAFGIPLLRCILNDRELDKRLAVAGSAESQRTDNSDNLLAFRSVRKSSSSSQGSVDNIIGAARPDSLTVPSHKRTVSCDSLSESECSHNTNSNLIDALSLSTSNPTSSRPSSLTIDNIQLNSRGEAQVPYVVRSCFKHIETYGLQTLGIFRIGCSKKRVNQLREEFDCGREVKLTEEHNPHDVAALLKEFFRGLPEPLLTRELYLPFLYAERIKDEQKRRMTISLLISMLPVPNRDTLWALLRFLALVSQHASDATDGRGSIIAGNKMDSHNLATLFGPNILHRTKVTSEKEFMSESVEHVEQSKEVIEVVKDMIDNHHELFEISASLRDDILRLLAESSQETVNKILRHLANQNQIETDPESMGSVFEETSNSPVLYHPTNSDADLIEFARKQTAASHRLLRVTKSVDDNLDLPTSNLLDPLLPDSQTISPVSKDSQKTLPFDQTPGVQQRFNSSHSYPSPTPSRMPLLKMPDDPSSPEVVLRGRLETGNFERPYSEGVHRSLNIPRPLYLREDSNSSISSALSSPLNNYGGSSSSQFRQWILLTPPTLQAPSPKQLYRSASSSSTLIVSPSTTQYNYTHSDGDSCDNSIPIAPVERERWKNWGKYLHTERQWMQNKKL